MRMAIRGTATATALALVWAAAVGCSSRGQKAQSAADAAPVVAPAPAPAPAAANAPAATAKITGTAFTEDADGARVVLSANAPLLYTSYEPRPNLLVVDLRDAAVASNVATPKVGGLVESIKFEELDELGKRITRLSITHSPDAHPDLRSVGQGLAIAFTGPTATAEAADAPAEAAPVASAPAVESAPLPVAAAPAAPKAAPVSVARGEAAHALESVTAQTKDGKVAILLLGDGWFSAKDFALANPPRIVVDLPGVKNEVKQRTIVVKDDVVTRVRISQFQTTPEYVTRVVVDLAKPMPHALVPDGERLAVVVGENAAAETMAQVAEEPAVTQPETAIAAAPAPVVEPPAAPVASAARAGPVRHDGGREAGAQGRARGGGVRASASASGPRPACRAAGSRSEDRRGRSGSSAPGPAGPGRRCARSRGHRRARAEARTAGPESAAPSRRRTAATRSSKPPPPSSTRTRTTRRRVAAPRTARAPSPRRRASSRVSRSRSTSRTPTSRTSSGRSRS